MGVATRIGEIAKENGISLKELSRQVDIPYTTLYHAVKRDSKMEFETVQKIAAALNIPWYELYTGKIADDTSLDILLRREKISQFGNETERLADANACLDLWQTSTELASGLVWADDTRSDWMKRNIPVVASIYNVDENSLRDSVLRYYEQQEIYLDAIKKIIYNEPLNLECLEKISKALAQMNDNGQTVAVERVQELAQIPAYQRTAEPAQDVPGGADDKEPEQK